MCWINQSVHLQSSNPFITNVNKYFSNIFPSQWIIHSPRSLFNSFASHGINRSYGSINLHIRNSVISTKWNRSNIDIVTQKFFCNRIDARLSGFHRGRNALTALHPRPKYPNRVESVRRIGAFRSKTMITNSRDVPFKHLTRIITDHIFANISRLFRGNYGWTVGEINLSLHHVSGGR